MAPGRRAAIIILRILAVRLAAEEELAKPVDACCDELEPPFPEPIPELLG
jgi:hypothetical protein